MTTRADQDPAQAEAQMAVTQERMATADDNLSEAVSRLEEVEDQTPIPDGEAGQEWGRLVNELDAEVTRLKQEYREAEGELGRQQQFWFEEDVDEVHDDDVDGD